MPRSSKLPVLNLPQAKNQVFCPAGQLVRFTSNLAMPTGMWVRLAVQNFTSIATGGGNAAQIYQKFLFLVKICPKGATPLTDF